MKDHFKALSLLEEETGKLSEKDAITFRELFRFHQFHFICPTFSTEMLIEIVYEIQFEKNIRKIT
jgi:hypothetical protein